MANRFVSPQQQFISYAGAPYAGGKLYFYISGTSTPTPTYQDEGLTTPNTNPAILDSAGDAGNIFLDPGIIYKVVLTDSNNNQIWVFDPVIPTDSATSSGFSPVVSCNASGTNSIMLTPITPSQQPALYSNFQVFAFVPVSTTTGAVSLQVGTLPSESVYVAPGVQAGAGTFVANDGPYYVAYGSLVAGSSPGFLLLNQNIGAVQSALPLPTPQGYLTLTSQTPVISTDAVAATTVFYTPYLGHGALVHNGISIVSVLLSSELSLALTTAQQASNIYDVYLAFNGGTPVIGTGPSWAAGTGGSVTAGSCARGTGSGGAALVRTQGIWTNAVSMSLIYNLGAGNVTITVPANQGVYLGSLFIDATAGQVSAYVTWGTSRKWGVWNQYNRQQIQISAGSNTTQYNYTTNAWRPFANNATSSVTVLSGQPEEPYNLTVNAYISGTTSVQNQSIAGNVGIGYNSQTSPSGRIGAFVVNNPTSNSLTAQSEMFGQYLAPPSIGINVIYGLENGIGSGNIALWAPGSGFQVVAAQWRG